MRRLLPAALGMSLLSSSASPAAPSLWVYFGTYTRGSESEGIYRCSLDLGSGTLGEPALAAEVDSPSFLAFAPDGATLFAVEETNDFEGGTGGGLRAFAVDPGSGGLRALDAVATGGAHPCHLSLDPAGRHVFVANYSGGNIAAFAIGEGGRIGARTAFHQHEGSSIDARRQEGPHAHSINLDPSGRRAYAADLGIDRLLSYQYDADKGTLVANRPAAGRVEPGSGPRHLAFSPDGRFAYTNCEMTSEVAGFRVDAATGGLEAFGAWSTLPAGFEGNTSTAEISMHPSGRFLYVSNRGHGSIARFAVGADGGLRALGHTPSGGDVPRNFAIDPSGQFLLAANQDNGIVQSFRIDLDGGDLTPCGDPISVPKAVCVRFLEPAGEFGRLFDGESFAGWEGKDEWFRIEDGCIVAGSLERPIPNNEFLVTEREFGDFELRFEAKLVGEGDNAGVQFWSQRVPDHHEMIGFQCDIGSMRGESIWGALYDESRRRRFLAEVPQPTRRITNLKDGWNRFRVVARGDSIRIWVNGGQAATWFETAPREEVPRKGRIGLQIHSGKPLEAWYRHIELREW